MAASCAVNDTADSLRNYTTRGDTYTRSSVVDLGIPNFVLFHDIEDRCRKTYRRSPA